jgi:4-methyl-5(b-hydroxyethyl)-thiazole monophosphate biosynthesis
MQEAIMATALMVVADGSEEIETLAAVDVLRRGGVEVTLAGLTSGPLTLSRQVRILADQDLDQALGRDYDAVLIPGGAGHRALMEDERVLCLLQRQAGRQGLVASICAGPKVLAKAGLLKGRRATSYPGALESLDDPGITLVAGQAVVVDGRIITSRGPGTTLAWALQVLELLTDAATRAKVEAGLQA